MENPLDQADLDALLKALLPVASEEQGGSEAGRLRPYDFRRPTKFNKELLRTLAMIHDSFARLLQSFFLAGMGSRAQVQVRQTNQLTYTEFLQLIPSPAVIGTFRLEPLPGTCFIEMSQNIAFAIVDRVFGGPGTDANLQRGLTEIELAVISRVITEMFNPLQEAWRNVAEVKPGLLDLETNSMFLQTAAPSEVLAVITFGLQIGEHMGHLTLAFPYPTVDPLLSKLSPHSWLSMDRTVAEEDWRMLQNSIQQAPVEVSVYLGRTRMSVAEFTALRVGEMLLLDTGTESELLVYAGDKLTFTGRPGVVRDRMSVRISRKVSERSL